MTISGDGDYPCRRRALPMRFKKMNSMAAICEILKETLKGTEIIDPIPLFALAPPPQPSVYYKGEIKAWISR